MYPVTPRWFICISAGSTAMWNAWEQCINTWMSLKATAILDFWVPLFVMENRKCHATERHECNTSNGRSSLWCSIVTVPVVLPPLRLTDRINLYAFFNATRRCLLDLYSAVFSYYKSSSGKVKGESNVGLVQYHTQITSQRSIRERNIIEWLIDKAANTRRHGPTAITDHREWRHIRVYIYIYKYIYMPGVNSFSAQSFSLICLTISTRRRPTMDTL